VFKSQTLSYLVYLSFLLLLCMVHLFFFACHTGFPCVQPYLPSCSFFLSLLAEPFSHVSLIIRIAQNYILPGSKHHLYTCTGEIASCSVHIHIGLGMREYIWSPVRGTGRSASEEEATRGTTPLSRATVWLREDQHTNCIQYFITILTARLYRWL